MHNSTTRSLLHVSAELRHIQGVYTSIFKTFWHITDYNSSTITSYRHNCATEPVIELPPTQSISTHDMGTRAIMDWVSVKNGETYSDIAGTAKLNLFYESLQFCNSAADITATQMYGYCNVLRVYRSKDEILVSRALQDGGVPLQDVAVNKWLHS